MFKFLLIIIVHLHETNDIIFIDIINNFIDILIIAILKLPEHTKMAALWDVPEILGIKSGTPTFTCIGISTKKKRCGRAIRKEIRGSITQNLINSQLKTSLLLASIPMRWIGLEILQPLPSVMVIIDQLHNVFRMPRRSNTWSAFSKFSWNANFYYAKLDG